MFIPTRILHNVESPYLVLLFFSWPWQPSHMYRELNYNDPPPLLPAELVPDSRWNKSIYPTSFSSTQPIPIFKVSFLDPDLFICRHGLLLLPPDPSLWFLHPTSKAPPSIHYPCRLRQWPNCTLLLSPTTATIWPWHSILGLLHRPICFRRLRRPDLPVSAQPFHPPKPTAFACSVIARSVAHAGAVYRGP